MTDTQNITAANPEHFTDAALKKRGWVAHDDGTYTLSIPTSDYHRSYIVQAMPLALYRGASPGAPATAWALENNWGSDAVLETKLEALAAAEAWVAREKDWRASDIESAKNPVPYAESSDADVPF